MTTRHGAGRRPNLIPSPGTKFGYVAVTALVRHAIITSQAVGPDEVPGNCAASAGRRRDRRATAHGDRRHSPQASRRSASGKGIGAPQLLRLVGDGHGRRRAVRRRRLFRVGQRADRHVFRRRDRQAGREVRPAAQGPARDADDLDRAVPRVPGDRPAGSVRVSGYVSEQPGVGRGHALADGLAGFGTCALLVHRRRYHRPQAHRGRPLRRQRTGRGGVPRQGPIPRRAEPRAPDAADSRADRRRVAPGVEARGRPAVRPWR